MAEMDSGSSALWVMDQDCRGCNASTAHLYDAGASTTHRDLGSDFKIQYGIGAVACNAISDTVVFGDITMDDYTFGSCYGEIDLFYPERYSCSLL